MGKPTKLTPEFKKRFFEAIRIGSHCESAAEFAGVTYSAVCRWVKRGDEEGEGIYYDFGQEYRKARADAELLLLSRVHNASTHDPRNAQWILERRYPEHWANSQKIQVQVNEKLDQELDKILDILERKLDARTYIEVLNEIENLQESAEEA